MARVKLNVPAKRLAIIEIPVRITDINYGNHVGNDSFISIIHEARMQWLKQHDFSELYIGGTGLIMSDLSIEFKKEGFYEDILEVHIHLGEVSTVSFELYYRIYTTRNDEQTLLLIGKTGMVSFDYTTKKVSPIPDLFKTLLTK